MFTGIATGFVIGIGPNDGFYFDSSKPYTFCRICGKINQSSEEHRRQRWSQKHARTHNGREHKQLALSGRFVTPEAAFVLCPYGIFSIQDLVLDPEVSHALGTAPRAPHDEVEV